MNKTYIQKGSDVRRDLSSFQITAKSIPDIQLDNKDFFSRSWTDQQGDEEYIPANPVFKAYELDLAFVYIGTLKSAGAGIRSFISYMQGSEFLFYDYFSDRGIRCRYKGYDSKATYHADKDAVDFTIRVKVNNPLCYPIKTLTGGNSITTTASCAMKIYWDDGTQNTYAEGATISKIFDSNEHFGIVIPSKLI